MITYEDTTIKTPNDHILTHCILTGISGRKSVSQEKRHAASERPPTSQLKYLQAFEQEAAARSAAPRRNAPFLLIAQSVQREAALTEADPLPPGVSAASGTCDTPGQRSASRPDPITSADGRAALASASVRPPTGGDELVFPATTSRNF
ncbi:hypothetical protein LAD64_24260 [Klebsiella pneumoniae]|nr:hypothetical protein [Klebsiella pneumoniae]